MRAPYVTAVKNISISTKTLDRQPDTQVKGESEEIALTNESYGQSWCPDPLTIGHCLHSNAVRETLLSQSRSVWPIMGDCTHSHPSHSGFRS